jgi:predicted metal-dependent phosphoesterase TrpH
VIASLVLDITGFTHSHTIRNALSVCICYARTLYNARTMIFDLHTHTDASDGALSPNELVRLARERHVDCLAITDHDTLGAYEQLDPDALQSIKLIVGIELSTVWQGHNIHIIGLNVDPDHLTLKEGINAQQDARESRAIQIAQRLAKTGIDDPMPAVRKIAGESMIGRPHFARHLVDIGHVKNLNAAFRKYLGNGKIGDVKQCWAALPEVVSWIQAAGGTAVLAHPVKYGMTWTKLRALLDDFKESGGRAIEVVCGSQELSVTRKLANLANDYEFAASCGSDFHQASNWSSPGQFPPLPDSVTKVWDLW